MFICVALDENALAWFGVLVGEETEMSEEQLKESFSKELKRVL